MHKSVKNGQLKKQPPMVELKYYYRRFSVTKKRRNLTKSPLFSFFSVGSKST